MITVLVPADDMAGDRAEIEGATYRHLFRARRLPVGVRLRVVDGQGQARWAEVEQVDRRRAVLRLAEKAPDHEPAYRLHLQVAILRPERASWLVEKATEIGVFSIRFMATERTSRQLTPASLERLRRVARAAVEQSQRSQIPEISGVESWEQAITGLSDPPEANEDRYVLDPEAPRLEEWRGGGPSGIVWVGPEGGFSRSEIETLKSLGCRAASFGHRILRVETAAVAAATQLLLV